MITAAEAHQITESTLSAASKAALEQDVETRIRAVAANGQASLRLEGLTDAQISYLRALLTQSKFQLSDVGLIIYW